MYIVRERGVLPYFILMLPLIHKILNIQKKEISTISTVARLYNIPRSTLRDRLNGGVYRMESRANCQKMTQNGEESLVRWILPLGQRGAAAGLPKSMK